MTNWNALQRERILRQSWQAEARRNLEARRAAAEELRRRRGEPEHPFAALSFRSFIESVNPHYVFYPHVQRLITELEAVERGEASRLMIFMPPRHGKSELTSRLFSAWYLLRHPDRWVGINSYAAALAHTFSRNARGNYNRAGGELSGEAHAAAMWETGKGGGMWAAGVGGPITGKGFHLGIVDDPIKNAAEASSATVREGQKDWWQSTFYTRREPNDAIIVIQTRWHEEDLSGWLLQEEAGDSPEFWRVMSFPAICPEPENSPEYPPTCNVVPDFRKPGEALCPERYPVGKLNHIRMKLGAYFWSALYDQNPTPKAGDFFRREWFPVVPDYPRGASLVRYWDKAGSKDKGDYSAGVLMAHHDGIFYVVDVVRGQWSSHDRNAVMIQTAELDPYGTTIWVEQEGGSGGKESAEISIQKLAGFTVRAEPVTGDKQVRAGPFSAQAEAGNVRLVRGDWNSAYLNELTSFPKGRNDDQVDASSGAFNKLALETDVQPGTLSAQLAGYIGLT